MDPLTGVVAVWKVTDEFVSEGLFSSLVHLFISSVCFPVFDVLSHGAGEQYGLLGDHADL